MLCCVLLCEALSFLGKVTVVMSSASERLRQLLQQHEQQQQQQQSLQHSCSNNNSNNSHSNGNNIQQKYNGDDDGTLSVCSKSTDALLNVSFEDAVAQPAEVAMPTIDPLLFSAFPAAEGISNSGTTIAPKEDKQQPHHNSHSLHPTTATTTATTTTATTTATAKATSHGASQLLLSNHQQHQQQQHQQQHFVSQPREWEVDVGRYLQRHIYPSLQTVVLSMPQMLPSSPQNFTTHSSAQAARYPNKTRSTKRQHHDTNRHSWHPHQTFDNSTKEPPFFASSTPYPANPAGPAHAAPQTHPFTAPHHDRARARSHRPHSRLSKTLPSAATADCSQQSTTHAISAWGAAVSTAQPCGLKISQQHHKQKHPQNHRHHHRQKQQQQRQRERGWATQDKTRHHGSEDELESEQDDSQAQQQAEHRAENRRQKRDESQQRQVRAPHNASPHPHSENDYSSHAPPATQPDDLRQHSLQQLLNERLRSVSPASKARVLADALEGGLFTPSASVSLATLGGNGASQHSQARESWPSTVEGEGSTFGDDEGGGNLSDFALREEDEDVHGAEVGAWGENHTPSPLTPQEHNRRGMAASSLHDALFASHPHQSRRPQAEEVDGDVDSDDDDGASQELDSLLRIQSLVQQLHS